jgi:hypothetical protein
MEDVHTQTLIQDLAPNFSTRVHDTYPLYVPLLRRCPSHPQKLAFHLTPGAQRVRINHPTHCSKRYDGSSLASGFDAARGGLLDLLRNSNSNNVVSLWINNWPYQPTTSP